MYIQAILAPPLADVPPEQRDRAHRAMMEQMMLLARGFPVDSSPVRCAAEMVGSAVALDPAEYELAPAEGIPTASPGRSGWTGSRTAPSDFGGAERKPDWQARSSYERYLRTIMASGRA